MFPHYLARNPKPKPVAGGLGGKERLEDARHVACANPTAGNAAITTVGQDAQFDTTAIRNCIQAIAKEIPELLRELAEMLESNETDQISTESLRAAEARGEYRYQKGYTIPLLATQVRLVEGAIYDVIRENLLSLNLSCLSTRLRLI